MLAVLWTLFLPHRPTHHKTADAGSFMVTFLTPLIGGVHRTADGGSSVDTFPTQFTKLPMVAVLWTLFLPHRPTHHKTADAGSFMDTFPTP